MNLPLHEMVARLKAIPGYAPEFDKAYPGQGISEVTVARAIASFERTVLSTESPFDRWRKGDQSAVSASATSERWQASGSRSSPGRSSLCGRFQLAA